METSSDYEQQLERRRTFSAWLSCGAICRVEEEVALAGKGHHTEAIFSYLTGNRISEACRLAQKEGEEVMLVSETWLTGNGNFMKRKPDSCSVCAVIVQ